VVPVAPNGYSECRPRFESAGCIGRANLNDVV